MVHAYRHLVLLFLGVLIGWLTACSKSELPPAQSNRSEMVKIGLSEGEHTVSPQTEVRSTPTPSMEMPVLLTKFSPNQVTKCEKDYVLGPFDRLMIMVEGQNEYNLLKELDIGVNGTFIFDFIGEVSALGLTQKELEEEIQKRLASDFLVNPKVSISVVKYASHFVYVNGEVNAPGHIIMNRECKWLSEVLMEAGGLRGNFNKNAFIISGQMDETNNPVMKVVDTYQIFIEGNRTKDVLVYDKDIIQVYDKGINPLGPQNSIFIFGEVNNPGMFPYSDDLTVLSAILIHSGGLSKTAKKSKTEVKRNSGGKVVTFTIDLNEVMEGAKDQDISLKPGDIIQVPRTFF